MKTLKVYDTVTKKMVNVEVNEEVYVHFNRTKWNIEDNNASFYKHEIQLLDELDYRSFVDTDTEERAINEVLIEQMLSALQELSEKDLKLIYLLFYEDKTERECAEIFGTSQPDISQKKKRILYKLNKLLKK